MKHTTVLFDEINNKTLIYAILNRNNEIFVLFAPITFMQICYKYILLYLLGCKLKFIDFNLNTLPKIYKLSNDNTRQVVNDKYVDTISYLKEYDLAMGYIFLKNIAENIHDVITIYNYIYCLKLNEEVDKIYIANNKCNFPEIFFDRKVFLYGNKRRKKLNHENCLNKSERGFVYSITSLIYKTFNIRVSMKKLLNFEVQGVLHGHGVFQNEEGKKLGTINNRLAEKYNTLSLSINSYLVKGGKTGKLNQIAIGDLGHYFKKIIKFIFYIKSLNNVSLYILIEILKYWVISIQMEILLTNINCKFVYADYESTYSHCLLSQSRKISGVKSFSHTNSLGYFPDIDMYRCSDYLFVWGDFMQELFERSSVMDTNCIEIAGYPNDTRDQQVVGQYMRENILKNNDGIIAIYDTTIGGKYCSKKDIKELLVAILNISIKLNYHVLIKPKKKLSESIYNSIRKYKDNFTIIDEGKRASMSCGFAADLVVGYGLSTIPNILASYGKKIVLYDPYENLWAKYPYYEKKYKIVSRSIKSLEENFYYWISYCGTPMDFSFIDAYADHSGSDRIIEFIDKACFPARRTLQSEYKHLIS